MSNQITETKPLSEVELVVSPEQLSGSEFVAIDIRSSYSGCLVGLGFYYPIQEKAQEEVIIDEDGMLSLVPCEVSYEQLWKAWEDEKGEN